MKNPMHGLWTPGADPRITRRDFLRFSGAAGAAASVEALLPGYARSQVPLGAPADPGVLDGTAGPIDIRVARTPIQVDGRRGRAVTMNGTVPGPLLRFREGEEAVIRVHNELDEDTSIHWHGLILPMEMDGVPGVSFPGIPARSTFEYRFPLVQYGTYWYHSHSGLQEQLGHYGPLIIEPAEPAPYGYDREAFVVLSDWTFEDPYRLLAKLKKQPDYYNFQKRTLGDFFADVAEDGLWATVKDRLMWGEMRMNPTDISDITGATYTYLMNGHGPESNWTALFSPGERVLLHVINASSATFFDVRVPGLPMTVVQVNGQYVEPVETDEFRVAIAETYDVIVEPREDRAYTVFAEAMDRSGFARGTLAPRAGMAAAVPARRERPLLSMMDMGMMHDDESGGGHGGHGGHGATGHDTHAGAEAPPADTTGGHAGHGTPPAADPHAGHGAPPAAADPHAGHSAAATGMEDREIRTSGLRPPGTLPEPTTHAPDDHGKGNAAVSMVSMSRLGEPGIGLEGMPWRVLTYAELRARETRPDALRPPDREIELHLTGNMERFLWHIDGKMFEEVPPIHFTYGERLRLTMVNDTMMNHPMHLHGMWMELENGQGEAIPRMHTINVKPAERISLLINADAPGRWAFHCHVLYHMEVGMFRVVQVSQPGETTEHMDHGAPGHEGMHHTAPPAAADSARHSGHGGRHEG